MITFDLPSPQARTPQSISLTIGVSEEARFVDTNTDCSLQWLGQAYSLDDGRMHVGSMFKSLAQQCSQRGWDGFEAEPVSRSAIDNAWRLVSVLPYGFPMPAVGAEPDGHVTLEWYSNPSRLLSVSVGSEGDLHYAALLGGTARQYGTEPFFGIVPPTLLEIIRRVRSV